MTAAAPAVAPGTDLARPERFVFLLLENFTLIAFASAIEPLRLANRMAGRTLYEWQVVDRDRRPGHRLERRRAAGRRRPRRGRARRGDRRRRRPQVKQAITRPVLTWLRREARKGLAIGALCTGAQVIAEAGLLDGRRCTIHWENRDSFEEDFPEIDLTPNVYVIDQRPLHRRRRHRLDRPDAEADRAAARRRARQPRRRPDDPHRRSAPTRTSSGCRSRPGSASATRSSPR